MYFNSRIFLVDDNNIKFFGTGPRMLLTKTDELGSLNKAAKDMDMSYSKAFSIIKNAEKELSVKLLVSQTGGKYGGGSTITEEAKEIIQKYDEFIRRSNQAIKEIYRDIF